MLNAISTFMVVVGTGLLIAVGPLLFLFWILMLVDAFKRRKGWWFLVLLLFTMFASALYFTLENPKIISRNYYWLKWVAISIVLLTIFDLSAMYWNTNKGSDTGPVNVSFYGTLKSKDLTPMEVDGNGSYIVTDGTGIDMEVQQASGFSACDRTAVIVPELNIGDSVSVNGIQREGIIYVCDAGTYIIKK